MSEREEDEDEKSPFLQEYDSSRDPFDSKNMLKIESLNAESHQYDHDENEVWWHYNLQRNSVDKGQWWSLSRKRDVFRWSLTLLTGLCCGLVALVVTNCTRILSSFKLDLFHRLIEQEKDGTRAFGTAFFFLIVINLLYATFAFCSVYLEPLAAGSGIPDVKCFLNGLNIPRLLRARTMFCKAVGLIFACAAGFPLGKEGPMVHIGAVVAAVISQCKLPNMNPNQKYQDFCNDREKRDFVACGAASGVAAAFGAPIGGVLFSLEEGASFWSTSLTWRCFFCAMTTVFFLYVVNTARRLFGHSDSTAMFSFGEFFSLQGEQSNYAVWELLLFLLIGGMGGIIGALFNALTVALFRWRSRFLRGPRVNFAEILLVSTVMSTLAIVLSLSWRKCTPLPVDMEGWNDQEKTLVTQLVPLYCDTETEYNELASLYLTDSDTAIRQLFHFREVGDHDDYTFSTAALLLFFIPYMLMAAITNGAALPAGMFVPSLLSGAAFGRLLGHLLHKLDDTRGTFADSGTYALMGAASITGGITRMTISLTVMILEATGDMQYVLPLMLTVLMARFIGNIFTEGIYDVNIRLRGLNFLDEDYEVCRSVELNKLTVRDIMTPEPICLNPQMQINECLHFISNYSHHCFPIVDKKDKILLGTISRRLIYAIIRHHASCPNEQNVSQSSSMILDWLYLETAINPPRKIECWKIPEEAKARLIDFGPYIDTSPYMISENASSQRAYRMFRTLGLRHLCVVDRRHEVLGIITRADLIVSKNKEK